MKKQIIVTALFAAVISMIGCKKDDPASKVTAISISPKSVVLNPNEPSIRLGLKLTPADAKLETKDITWSCSDTTVATVSNTGYVEAMYYGKCYVYAQVGDLKDSCLVEVKTYMESLIFNGAIVWSEDTTVAKDPNTGEYRIDTIEASDGTTYRAYQALAKLWVFSDGFYVNNSGYLDGTAVGTVLEIEAPMYYATAYLNNSDRGTIFCLGKWAVTAVPTLMKEGKPGAIADEAEYVKQLKNFVAAYNADEDYGQYLEAAGKQITGASLTIEQYMGEGDQAGYYSSYIADALCTEAELSLNGNFPASQYMCGMDYSIITFKEFSGDWGIQLDEDENEKLIIVDETIQFEDPITSTYGEKPAESVKKKLTPIHVPVISENPELAARIQKQLNNRHVDIRKKF